MSKHLRIDEQLLTLKDIATIEKCSVKTIRRRVKAGKLRVIRDGRMVRVNPEDYHASVERRRSGRAV